MVMLFSNSSRLALLLLLAQLIASPALAEEELQASVDRNTIYENETLRLEIRGYSDMNTGFGSVFQFSPLDIPAPDLEHLEQHFQILTRNQQMSIQSANDRHSAEITWSYLLAPRTAGNLEIPPIRFNEHATDPIAITVHPGVSPAAARDGTETRLTIEVSASDVYVQQQFTVTQRLYYQPPLLHGELSQPDIPGALVERVGDQQEYQEQDNGREWQVVERTFAVIPQQTGTLQIPRQEFQGRKRDGQGAVAFLRAHSEPQQITVNPPPDNFSGDLWLPAASLDIREEWSSDPDSLEAGESITRTLTVRGLGVLPEALPALEIDYPDAVREYPDPPIPESRFTENTLESRVQKSAALVPLEAGTTTLPEIRIPWWDVVDDQERVAVIPARDLVIAPAAGLETSPEDTGRDLALPAAANRSPGAHLPTFWAWLALVLATGWLVTGIAWWRNRHQGQEKERISAQQKILRERFQALCEAARKGAPETLTLLPQWASLHYRQPNLKTIGEVTQFANDPALTRELDALERYLFARPEEAIEWHGEELVSALQRLAGEPRTYREER